MLVATTVVVAIATAAAVLGTRSLLSLALETTKDNLSHPRTLDGE
jgi:hypothetical protein